MPLIELRIDTDDYITIRLTPTRIDVINSPTDAICIA